MFYVSVSYKTEDTNFCLKKLNSEILMAILISSENKI